MDLSPGKDLSGAIQVVTEPARDVLAVASDKRVTRTLIQKVFREAMGSLEQQKPIFAPFVRKSCDRTQFLTSAQLGFLTIDLLPVNRMDASHG